MARRAPGRWRAARIAAVGAAAALLLQGCFSGGGGGTKPASSSGSGGLVQQGVFVAPSAQSLTVGEVQRILAQAVAEAQARGLLADIAVVDRVGNVLAVFRMSGADPDVTVRPGAGGNQGLQGITVIPRELAAIAKAVTGAYLSSAGNAFTTRTASQIVQQHFPPGPSFAGLESGPLFGVQFSQLPCSDLSTRYVAPPGAPLTVGPKRAPLGLSADPGGLPLYKSGVLVGGIGVMADEDYGFDTDAANIDTDGEELVAVAGTDGFAAPASIRANLIDIDGTSLRYTDRESESLLANPAAAPSFASLVPGVGALLSVRGYFAEGGAPAVVAGTAYGAPASGIRPATGAEYVNPDIYVLVDAANANRFPPIAGTDGASVASPLTAAEVRAIVESAFAVMTRSRAQIRQPLGSRAQVSISVVDTYGEILAIARAPDAPIFGIDVSLQKARTAAFFSSALAGAQLLATPAAPATPAGAPATSISGLVAAARSFLADPTALTGAVAFSDRAGGNLSRPYFPDGQLGTANGPFSRPIAEWSPFATGLQEDLVRANILEHVLFVSGALGSDTAARCTSVPDIPAVVPARNRLQNGIQIFPGSVPIYRGSALVGGIGVSGDGIDQDDMISFLGLHEAGLTAAGAGLDNAPAAMRADQVAVPQPPGHTTHLRYVNCPFSPYVGSSQQNVCQGL